MQVRRERNAILRELSNKKRTAFYRTHQSTIRPVLTEPGKVDGTLTGFTDNYIKVQLPGRELETNQLLQVELGCLAGAGTHLEVCQHP